MLYEIFIVGSVWFWLLFGVFTLAILIELTHEAIGACIGTIIAFLAIMFIFGNFNFAWIVANPTLLLSCAGIYLIGGIIVSFFKWFFFVRDAKDEYNELKTKYIKYEKLNISPSAVIPEGNREHFKKWIVSEKGYGSKLDGEHIVPQVRRNKELVITWMTFWPWVAFWSIFSDVFRRLWIETFRVVQKIYQSFSNLIFSSALKDIAIVPKKTETTSV